MPVKPEPVIYSCLKCGWSKYVAPKSDALMPGDYYDACPKCGNESLERKPAGSAGTMLRAALALGAIAVLAGKILKK